MASQRKRKHDGSGTSSPEDDMQLGSIVSVRMVNFMCHENVFVELGPKVNFITGRNGSGKSAVFTALLCAFGGAARATGRASNGAALIREGCSTATIEVVLRNVGTERFADESMEDFGLGPGEYGETITLERKIQEKGGGYTVKDALGQVRGRTMELVTRLRDHFYIQTDNPILLMGQDQSRQFLQASTPAQKFTLIHRAIQMDKIEDELSHALESIRTMDKAVESLQKEGAYYDERLREAQTQYDSTQELRNLEERLHTVQIQAAWSEVQRSRNQIQTLEREIEEAREKKAIREEELQEVQRQAEDHQSELAQKQMVVAAKMAEVERIASEGSAIANRARVAERALNTASSRHKRASEQLTQDTLQVTRARAALEQARKATGSKHVDIDALRTEVDRLDNDIKRNQIELVSVQENNVRVREELQTASREFTEAQRTEQSAIQHHNSLKRELAGLETAQGKSETQRITAFGDNLVRLNALIQRDRDQFKRAPIGPIGTFISVKKGWETAFQSQCVALNGYICVDNDDRKKLVRLFAEARCGNLTCYMMPLRYWDEAIRVPNENKPPHDGMTVMDLLDQLPPPIILNTLIEQKRIETIAVFEQRDQAMLWSHHGRQPDRFTLSIDRRGTTFYRKGSSTVTMDYIESARAPRIIPAAASVADLSDKRREIDQAAFQIRPATEQRERVQEHVNDLKQQLSNGTEREEALSVAISKAEKQKDVLSRKLEDAQQADEGESPQVLTKIQELEEAETQVVRTTETVEQLQADLQRVTAEHQQARTEVDALKRTLEDPELEALQNEVTALSSDRTLDLAQATLASKVNRCDALIKEKMHEMEEMIEALQEFETAAAECGDEPEEPISATSAQLIAECKSLDRKIQRARDHMGISGEMALLQLEEATAVRDKYLNELDRQQRLCKLFTTSYLMREHQNKIILAALRKSLQASFEVVMMKRNLYGQVTFDDDTREMVMSVDVGYSQPTQTRIDGVQAESSATASTDTRQMSGGERSFSTISLLMALWRNLEFPFFGVDEFDVYMDAITRGKAMEQLLDAAKTIGRQFLFLTPLDRGSIQLSDDVRIIEMNPPIRNDHMNL